VEATIILFFFLNHVLRESERIQENTIKEPLAFSIKKSHAFYTYVNMMEKSFFGNPKSIWGWNFLPKMVRKGKLWVNLLIISILLTLTTLRDTYSIHITARYIHFYFVQ
jgi:hypothetical protein